MVARLPYIVSGISILLQGADDKQSSVCPQNTIKVTYDATLCFACIVPAGCNNIGGLPVPDRLFRSSAHRRHRAGTAASVESEYYTLSNTVDVLEINGHTKAQRPVYTPWPTFPVRAGMALTNLNPPWETSARNQPRSQSQAIFALPNEKASYTELLCPHVHATSIVDIPQSVTRM
jgi:hypothetical protein